MNDIIKMAREAGFVVEDLPTWQPNRIFHTYHMIDDQLKTFAGLVAAQEREACAKLVEGYCGAWDDKGFALAAAIRRQKCSQQAESTSTLP